MDSLISTTDQMFAQLFAVLTLGARLALFLFLVCFARILYKKKVKSPRAPELSYLGFYLSGTFALAYLMVLILLQFTGGGIFSLFPMLVMFYLLKVSRGNGVWQERLSRWLKNTGFVNGPQRYNG